MPDEFQKSLDALCYGTWPTKVASGTGWCWKGHVRNLWHLAVKCKCPPLPPSVSPASRAVPMVMNGCADGVTQKVFDSRYAWHLHCPADGERAINIEEMLQPCTLDSGTIIYECRTSYVPLGLKCLIYGVYLYRMLLLNHV